MKPNLVSGSQSNRNYQQTGIYASTYARKDVAAVGTPGMFKHDGLSIVDSKGTQELQYTTMHGSPDMVRSPVLYKESIGADQVLT